MLVQLLVGDLGIVLGIVAFPDDRHLIAAFCQMPVDAVGGHVERAVLEPFDRDVRNIVVDVLDLGERLDPVDTLGLLGPESLIILDRGFVHGLVFGLVDVCSFGELGWNRMNMNVAHVDAFP